MSKTLGSPMLAICTLRRLIRSLRLTKVTSCWLFVGDSSLTQELSHLEAFLAREEAAQAAPQVEATRLMLQAEQAAKAAQRAQEQMLQSQLMAQTRAAQEAQQA